MFIATIKEKWSIIKGYADTFHFIYIAYGILTNHLDFLFQFQTDFNSDTEHCSYVDKNNLLQLQRVLVRIIYNGKTVDILDYHSEIEKPEDFQAGE